MQQAKSRGLSLRLSPRNWDASGGHQEICPGREPTNQLLSAKERAKAEDLVLDESQMAAD